MDFKCNKQPFTEIEATSGGYLPRHFYINIRFSEDQNSDIV